MNGIAVIAFLAAFAPLFPFQPSHDAPPNITNVSTWGAYESGRPAGSHGFIKADGDRFIDGDGVERRFLGTNICFTGCFPEKADADRVAEDLSRYGINLVRLHYVHHKTPPGHAYPKQDSFIEPVQLDRFDYLFSKLKEKGIYVYFQLNIGRKFSAANGFENASKLPWYNNGIDMVDGRMIQLHKKFVYDILTHSNPYTGLEYRNEPAISMLEITNENSVVFCWFNPKFKLHNITEPYQSEFKELWNEFLSRKYGDTKSLKTAWCEGLKGDGHSLMDNGIFNSVKPGKGWWVQEDATGKSSWKMVAAGTRDKLRGNCYLSLQIDQMGKNKRLPMLSCSYLEFKVMEPLTLKFKARADKAMKASVRFNQAHGKYLMTSPQQELILTPKWKEYSFEFVAAVGDDNVRMAISDFSEGTVDFADFELTSGVNVKWPEGQSLEAENMEWPSPSEWRRFPQRASDFTEFLAEVENDYFYQLKSYLSEQVHPLQPVTGTQLQYGFDLPQAGMDFCDMHSYWSHSKYMGKAWNQDALALKLKALVNGDRYPGTNLMTLARGRILGRPLTVSEYDHPNLNNYAAEGNLIATAFGAFQNWSGFIQFAWTHDTDFFRDVLSPQFDMCSATEKLVHLPACWSMFVRGDVAAGGDDIIFAREITSEKEIRDMAESRSTFSTASEKTSLMNFLPLAVATGKDIKERPELFSAGAHSRVIRNEDDVPEDIRAQFKNKEVKSSTGELTWNWQSEGAGYFKVDTRLTKVFTGFVRGRSFDFDGLTLNPGQTRMDWLTLSLTRATGGPAGDSDGRLAPGAYLLAATGVCQNTGMKVVECGKDYISCGRDLGGEPGTGPILCEGIDAGLILKGLGGKVRCYALNPSGERTMEVPVSGGVDALLRISPEYRTVWYELVVEE